MHIVGITGRAGAGKDTVADYLVRHKGYIKLSWAAPLKAGLAAMGFPEPADRADKEKLIPGFTFSWRDAAQKLGTEWGRGLDPDIWVKVLEQSLSETKRYVISDVRFENEAVMIRRAGGKVLHLTGRQADLGALASHASEAGVPYMSCDMMIDNSASLDWTMEQVLSTLRRHAG